MNTFQFADSLWAVRQALVLWHVSKTYMIAAMKAPYSSNNIHYIYDLSPPTSPSCSSTVRDLLDIRRRSACLIFPVTCSSALDENEADTTSS